MPGCWPDTPAVRNDVLDYALEVEHFDRRQSVDAWLERVDTPADAAARIRELLSDRIDDGLLAFESIVLKARRSQK